MTPRSFAGTLTATALLLGVWGCGGEEGSGVANIVVSPAEVEVPQRGTVQLDASLYDEEGALMSDRPLNWSSSDAAVVSVNANGFLQAGRTGSAVITAETNGVSATVPVTVTPVATSVTVTPNPVVLNQNGSVQLTATVRDLDGEPIVGAFVFYSSANANIVTVNSTGLVQSTGPAGNTTVSVSHATLFTDIPVTVNPAP